VLGSILAVAPQLLIWGPVAFNAVTGWGPAEADLAFRLTGLLGACLGGSLSMLGVLLLGWEKFVSTK
jgi:hypothetical protein